VRKPALREGIFDRERRPRRRRWVAADGPAAITAAGQAISD